MLISVRDGESPATTEKNGETDSFLAQIEYEEFTENN